MSGYSEMHPLSRPQPGADMFHDHLDVLRGTHEERYARFHETSDDMMFRGYDPSPFYKAYEELVVMRSGLTLLTPSEERRNLADLRTISARSGLARAICSTEVSIDDLGSITEATVEAIKEINGVRRLPRKLRHQLHSMTYALGPTGNSRMMERTAEVRYRLPHSIWGALDAEALSKIDMPHLY